MSRVVSLTAPRRLWAEASKATIAKMVMLKREGMVA